MRKEDKKVYETLFGILLIVVMINFIFSLLGLVYSNHEILSYEGLGETNVPKIEISDSPLKYSYYVYYEYYTCNEHGTGAISLFMDKKIINANDVFALANYIKNNELKTTHKVESVIIVNFIEFQQNSESVVEEIGCD